MLGKNNHDETMKKNKMIKLQKNPTPSTTTGKAFGMQQWGDPMSQVHDPCTRKKKDDKQKSVGGCH